MPSVPHPSLVMADLSATKICVDDQFPLTIKYRAILQFRQLKMGLLSRLPRQRTHYLEICQNRTNGSAELQGLLLDPMAISVQNATHPIPPL